MEISKCPYCAFEDAMMIGVKSNMCLRCRGKYLTELPDKTKTYTPKASVTSVSNSKTDYDNNMNEGPKTKVSLILGIIGVVWTQMSIIIIALALIISSLLFESSVTLVIVVVLSALTLGLSCLVSVALGIIGVIKSKKNSLVVGRVFSIISIGLGGSVILYSIFMIIVMVFSIILSSLYAY